MLGAYLQPKVKPSASSIQLLCLQFCRGYIITVTLIVTFTKQTRPSLFTGAFSFPPRTTYGPWHSMAFPLFSRFPVELQIMIWEVSPTQRRIFVNHDILVVDPGTRHTPSILHTCRLSRKIGLPRFTIFVPNYDIPESFRRRIYVDYTFDVFLFPSFKPRSNDHHETVSCNNRCCFSSHSFP